MRLLAAVLVLLPSMLAAETRPRARPLTGRTFARTAERVARGRYLAEGPCQCVVCHSPRDDRRPGSPPVAGRLFSGRVLSEHGRFRQVAPNLTPDRATGAGRWSDDALARAIREGIGHDGRALGSPMWWWAFRSLSDEDLASVVVYLRSLPPIVSRLPARKLRAIILQPEPLAAPVPAPPLETPAQRGLYLVKIADCNGCHSAWEAPRNPGVLAGGEVSVDAGGRTITSANLTPDPTGIPYYDAALFRQVMRTGTVVARELSPAMPWVAFASMTDDDLDAVFAFLRAARPIRHRVDNTAPPTPCAICGQTHGGGAANRPVVLQRAPVDPATFDDRAGRYRFDGGLTFTLRRDGDRLMGQADGAPPVEVVPLAGGEWDAPPLGNTFSFVRDAGGHVTAIVSHELEDVIVKKLPATPGKRP